MPISPFLMEGGLSNWPKSNWPKAQIRDSREKCPICGNVLTELFGAIGGFPGHEHVHPGSLVGYNCYECMRQFSLDEILLIKEKKTQREMPSKNYRENVRVIFKSYYFYLIVACFMIIQKSFWVGIMAGVFFAFLLPLLAAGLEKTFAPLIKLIRKKFESLPPDKSSDDLKAP